jgi:hypothetical protein
MNDALACYRDESRVGSISGYTYPCSRRLPETFFIRGADCWSWATWRDRWTYFESDGKVLLRQLRERNLTSAFDFEGALGYTAMLEDQIAGKNDSWAVRWHASCFLRDLLILYPAKPLARNIGLEGAGTHSNEPDESFDVELSPHPVGVGGISVEENAAARATIREFFLMRRQPPSSRKSWGYRIRRIIKTIRRATARQTTYPCGPGPTTGAFGCRPRQASPAQPAYESRATARSLGQDWSPKRIALG